MDIDSLSLGLDFVEELERALANADVALILIGPQWLAAADEGGSRRLDDPDDFVRIEITAALQSRARVIPVLFDGVQMPKSMQRPDDLARLPRRQALMFQRNSGMRDLVAAIKRVAPENQGSSAPKREVTQHKSEMQGQIGLAQARKDPRYWITLATNLKTESHKIDADLVGRLQAAIKSATDSLAHQSVGELTGQTADLRACYYAILNAPAADRVKPTISRSGRPSTRRRSVTI